MKKIVLSIALVAFMASFTAPTVSAAFASATCMVKQDKEVKAKDDKKCAPGCTKACCKDKKTDSSKAKADAKPNK